jgi:hypothetical protein
MTVPLGIQRAIAATGLAGAGAVSLPVAAASIDRGIGTENFILPGQLAGMTALGAGTGAALPKLMSHAGGHGRGALIGAAIGAGVGVVSDVATFALFAG